MDKNELITKYINSNHYSFMHKDIEVCRMDISSDGGIDVNYVNADAVNLFPFGVENNLNKFKKWWKDRAIPITRHDAKYALNKLGYSSTGNMLINNLALSLNDCYWIKPTGSDLKWKDVNLYIILAENPL